MKGETRLTAANDTHVQLNVSAPWLPLVVLRKYFPVKMMGSPPLESLVAQPAGGRVATEKLGINGTLGELRNVAQSAAKGLVSFDAELRERRLETEHRRLSSASRSAGTDPPRKRAYLL